MPQGKTEDQAFNRILPRVNSTEILTLAPREPPHEASDEAACEAAAGKPASIGPLQQCFMLGLTEAESEFAMT